VIFDGIMIFEGFWEAKTGFGKTKAYKSDYHLSYRLRFILSAALKSPRVPWGVKLNSFPFWEAKASRNLAFGKRNHSAALNIIRLPN
jgi:hypothetical protein